MIRTRELAQVLSFRRDDVIAFNRFENSLVIEPVALLGLAVNVAVKDHAPGVLLVPHIGKIEVATVVTETVILGIDILPSPILRRKFAIHRVLVRDIVPLVIMESPGELIGGIGATDLDRLENRAVEQIDILVSRNKNTDRRRPVLRIP